MKWMWSLLLIGLVGWFGCQPSEPYPGPPDINLVFVDGPPTQPSDAATTPEPQPEPGNIDITRRESTPDVRPPEPQPEPVADSSTTEPILPEPQPEPPISPEPPPPTLQSWIGEPCQTDGDCDYANGYCLKEANGYKGGHCTLSCTRTCPDKNGKPTTFCIDDGTGKGICVSQCPAGNCRAGYQCNTRSRINEPGKQNDVCTPQTGTPGGPSKTFLYIGASHSSGTNLAKVLIAFFKQPKTFCSTAKTSNNSVYSYTRPSAAARHWSAKSGSNKDWLCRQTKIYTNGTASGDTTGPAMCASVAQTNQSPYQGLINKHKPNAFLIQLGDNSLGFSESYVKGKVKDLLDQIPAGSLCMWMAPTYGVGTELQTKKKRMEGWLRDALKNYTRLTCHLLTSYDEMEKQTTCNPFNVSDKLHMTSCGARLLGETTRTKICQLGIL